MSATLTDIEIVAVTDAHEGPVYAADEHALYFTTKPIAGDPPRVDIKRLDLATRAISVVRPDANVANGMVLGHDGRLIVCEQGSFHEPARITAVDRHTGATRTVVDRDAFMTHPQFRAKLEAVGFGVFIPVFFIASGIRFDLNALLDHPSNLVKVPIFLAALFLVRGLPALLYRGFVGGRRTAVAAFLQSTSLPFIVAATAIGQELGLLDGAQSAALIAAGLLSVLIFPVPGLALLHEPEPQGEAVPAT